MSLFLKPSNGNGKSGNRHNLDIVRDMLTVASVKTRKTRIMYQANLSFVQVEKYLRDLLEKGLLNHDGQSGYSITRKGLEFLRLYEEYSERCKQLQEQVNQSVKDRLLLERMCSSHPDSGFKLTKKVTFPYLMAEEG